MAPAIAFTGVKRVPCCRELDGLKPAKQVRDDFGLESDDEFRAWHQAKDGVYTNVVWSEIWGTHREKGDDPEGEHGERLQVSPAFLAEFLTQTNKDLIIKVEIERRIARYSYERGGDDYPGYQPPYFRIFLLSADGEWRSS